MKANQVSKQLDRDIKRDVDSVVKGARDELSDPALRYLRMLADPLHSKPTRGIAPWGGYAGRTGLVTAVASGQAVTGTGGIACLSTSPAYTGPFSDRIAAIYTDQSSNTLTDASAVPDSTGTGITTAYNSGVNQPAAGLALGEFLGRPLAHAIYIYPDANFTSQGGEIFMLETSGHSQPPATFTLLYGHPRTRQLSGIAPQDGVQIVCNWHPEISNVANDFEFVGYTAAATSFSATNVTNIVVLKSGAAATVSSFRWKIVTIYEVIGRRASGLKAGIFDSRGWDLVANALKTKTVSGWVGKPHEAHHSYLSSIWASAKRLGKSALRLAHEPTVKTFANEVAGFLL